MDGHKPPGGGHLDPCLLERAEVGGTFTGRVSGSLSSAQYSHNNVLSPALLL
jgi:hypothetical protein